MRAGESTRRIGISTACLALLVVVGGCGGVTNLGNALADVDGSIYYQSGPATPSVKPVRHGPQSGTIFFVKPDGTHPFHMILRHEPFAVGIPEGTYVLRTQSGSAYCPDIRIHARRGHVLHVNVICTVT